MIISIEQNNPYLFLKKNKKNLKSHSIKKDDLLKK